VPGKTVGLPHDIKPVKGGQFANLIIEFEGAVISGFDQKTHHLVMKVIEGRERRWLRNRGGPVPNAPKKNRPRTRKSAGAAWLVG